MRYIHGITTIPPAEPDNALIMGQTVHTGIEKSLEEAIKEYSFSYPIITDEHINEIIKFETVIPLARAAIPLGGAFEVEIADSDFHGFIDYLVPVGDGYFDLYDFKYSNNVSGYKQSNQLHLYKYFWERNNPGKKIRNMYFLFIPKVSIRQKKTETLLDFRQRLKEELAGAEVKTVQIGFNPEKVIEFLFGIKAIKEEKDFPQNKSYLCRFCEYQENCEKGWNYFMKLPENKRRNIEAVEKRVLWIYGVPFCGKTTFANSFPDPLMLNTDGNIKFVDTDGIIVKLKDYEHDFDVLDDVVYEWEQRTGMKMDFDTYIGTIYQKDVNNYLLIDRKTGAVKAKGGYVMKLNDLSYDLPIINKALVDYMIHGIPVRRTIMECQDLREFQLVSRISSKYTHILYGDKPIKEKCIRVFASNNPADPGVKKVHAVRKTTAKLTNSPEHCFIFNDDVKSVPVPDKLDRQWYIDFANKRLSDFGVV